MESILTTYAWMLKQWFRDGGLLMAKPHTCIYCGQEFPGGTTLCPMCNRAQPAGKQTHAARKGISYRQAGQLTVLVAVAVVGLMSWATG